MMQYNPHTDMHEPAPAPQPQAGTTSPGQGQPNPQGQPQAPQGDGSQPQQPQNPLPNDTTTNDPSQGNIAQAVEQKLNNLPDKLKAFAAGIMVPEMAEFMTEFMGPEVGSVFQKYADPSRVLVSLPKTALAGTANSDKPPVKGDKAASEKASKTESKSKGTAFGKPVDKILNDKK